MKKLLLWCFCTLMGFSTFGQIEKGTRFWGVTLDASGNFSKGEEQMSAAQRKSNGHDLDLNLQWGTFVKSNTLFGVGLGLEYQPISSTLSTPGIQSLKYRSTRIEYRVEPFMRKYKALNERFRIFIQPSVSIGVQMSRARVLGGYTYPADNAFKAGISLVPGISYQIGKRFAVESDLSIARLRLNYFNSKYSGTSFGFDSSLNGAFGSYFTVRGAFYIN